MARIADPQLADRRRRQILDAGVTCFRRRGFHQTTMQEICAEAGISAGALYRYFAGKTDLIAAIAEELHAENDNALLRASEEVGFMPALEALAADAYLRFSEGEAALFADVLAESMRDEAIAASLRPIVLRGADTFAEAMKRAQARGEVDPTLDPHQTANVIAGLIQGIGLRRAFLRQLDAEAALAEFRLAAERLLSPRHET